MTPRSVFFPSPPASSGLSHNLFSFKGSFGYRESTATRTRLSAFSFPLLPLLTTDFHPNFDSVHPACTHCLASLAALNVFCSDDEGQNRDRFQACRDDVDGSSSVTTHVSDDYESGDILSQPGRMILSGPNECPGMDKRQRTTKTMTGKLGYNQQDRDAQCRTL